jgi:hypothetical protein
VARREDGTPMTSVFDFTAGDGFSLVVRDGQVDARTIATRPDTE